MSVYHIKPPLTRVEWEKRNTVYHKHIERVIMDIVIAAMLIGGIIWAVMG